MAERRITDGGRDLRAYLTEHGINVPDFCEKHGLDRIQVQRVLNGDRWKRVSVEFADAIERATEGQIGYRRFLPCTAVSTDEDAKPLTDEESRSSNDEADDESGPLPVVTSKPRVA